MTEENAEIEPPKWFFAPQQFRGTFSMENDSMAVDFTVGIDQSGGVNIGIARFERTQAAKFLIDEFHEQGTRFPQFTLRGETDSGQRFETDNLIVTSLGGNFLEDYASLCPAVTCSFGTLTMPAPGGALSSVKWKLIGFENYPGLSASSSMGKVEMAGSYEPGNGLMTGGLIVYQDQSGDFNSWKVKVDALLGHVRGIMSFAAARMLTVPIIEIVEGNTLTVEILSQSTRGSTGLRPFQALNQQPIFDCAVRSFFDEKVTIKSFEYAVEWFTMGSTYPESNLIFAMTVLENMIDSNLTNREKAMLSDKEFSKLRGKISDLLIAEIPNFYGEPDRESALADFESKLPDFNRKSLIKKLKLLASKWGVSLDGIDEHNIAAAKSARDKVVHRGKYSASADSTHDLDDHVRLVRELIVRFVLTAFNYKGRYYTFVGGYSEKIWPPAAALASVEPSQDAVI